MPLLKAILLKTDQDLLAVLSSPPLPTPAENRGYLVKYCVYKLIGEAPLASPPTFHCGYGLLSVSGFPPSSLPC